MTATNGEPRVWPGLNRVVSLGPVGLPGLEKGQSLRRSLAQSCAHGVPARQGHIFGGRCPPS